MSKLLGNLKVCTIVVCELYLFYINFYCFLPFVFLSVLVLLNLDAELACRGELAPELVLAVLLRLLWMLASKLPPIPAPLP
jgi:hypothetical protein